MRVLKKSIWPHQVTLPTVVTDRQDPRLVWLEEKMPKDRWYLIGPNRYCFKVQQDAVMFTLRWS
jgi:hypothetical protein